MKAKIAFAVAAPIAFFLAFAAWALASPVGASPDDDYHLTSIWCGQGLRDGLCEAGDADDERRVPSRLLEAPSCFAFNPEQSASCPLSPSEVLVSTNRGNFSGDYPPVFYGVMSVFVGPDVEASVIAMRLANAAIFVGVLTTLALLLPRRFRLGAVLPFTIGAVPLGMFLVPSVNPSSWAVLSALGLWIAVVGVVRAEEKWRRIALSVFALLLALIGAGARSDAAVYAGIAVMVALVVTFQRSRRWFFAAGLGVAIAMVAAVSFLTSGQSSAIAGDAAPAGGLGSLIANIVLLPSLWVGSFGTWGLGWLDTALPPLVWVGSIIAVASLLFSGLRRMTLRKGLALGLTFAALAVIPLYILHVGGVTVGAAVQPRYIYPLLLLLMGLVLWDRDATRILFTRLQWIVLGTLLISANAVALHTDIRRYVTGVDQNGPDLEAALEWWWSLAFGPTWVWLAGSIAFAAAIVLVVRWASAEALVRAPAQDLSPP